MLHAAALNLLVRLRRVVADPPTLTTSDDGSGDAVPVADPTVPVEALHGDERRRYHRYRRQRDPLGQGHITTWRMMLIKVACEVIQSTASHSHSPARPLALSAVVLPRLPGYPRPSSSCTGRSVISPTAWFSRRVGGFSARIMPNLYETPHE